MFKKAAIILLIAFSLLPSMAGIAISALPCEYGLECTQPPTCTQPEKTMIDAVLCEAIISKVPIAISLVNGEIVEGEICSFDQSTIFFKDTKGAYMIDRQKVTKFDVSQFLCPK